jgi:hypothetical protein
MIALSASKFWNRFKKYIKTFEELFTVSILLKSLSPLRIFYSFI